MQAELWVIVSGTRTPEKANRCAYRDLPKTAAWCAAGYENATPDTVQNRFSGSGVLSSDKGLVVSAQSALRSLSAADLETANPARCA